MQVHSYLYFNGRCDEAVAFYERALGASVAALVRFKDSPGTPAPVGAADKVLHAELRIGDSKVLASDGDCQGTANFRGFSLTLDLAQDGDADRLFASLSNGGHVQVPLTSTSFASCFGMVTDRFGVLWTLVRERAAQANA